jgi:formylglycine-generating enzyme required for sulfatase activity
VADWYGETYYSQSPSSNPTGPVSGKFHVLRGGSWSNHENNTRSANRDWNDPDYRFYNLGFRCARREASP